MAQRRRDPIAAFKHLPGNLRISRFVGPQKRNCQAEEIRKNDKRDERYPDDAVDRILRSVSVPGNFRHLQ